MGLYEVAKDALSVAQKADNIELVQKLLDVQKMALDMQEKQQALSEEISALKNDKLELMQLLAKRDDYVLENSVWWKKTDLKRTQPYCPNCFANKKELPLYRGSDSDLYYCPDRICGYCRMLGNGALSHLPEDRLFDEQGFY